MWLKFRTQKNGKHGAERLFEWNDRPNATLCMVKTMYRVVERFIRCRSEDDTDTPLSIYINERGDKQLLTSADIEQHIRSIAIQLYNLDPVKDKDEIMRWSAHSLRVGACVFLHSAGFTALDIKWILRWESDSYKVYLRNFPGLSRKQNQAFAKLDDYNQDTPMPLHFGYTEL